MCVIRIPATFPIMNALPTHVLRMGIIHLLLIPAPASTSTLMLVMSDNVPGGCGNDFALDDITFRECVKKTTQLTATPKKTSTIKQSTASKPMPKKVTTSRQEKVQTVQVIQPTANRTT